MRILVVENSDSIRSMIEAFVSTRGHEVTSCSTGVKGLDLAGLQPPDVILLDMHLPGAYDGFDVCEKLRAANETKHVPIIVISAMSDNESKAKALQRGATAYYTKPFSPMALLKEIESLPRRSLPET